MTRKALRDDRLDEYFVPAKTEIYVPPYFIHRHPDLWSNPDHFDPDRFAPDLAQGRHPMSMLPFSAGPRNCIGEHLARMEMEIHLSMIIAKSIRLRYSEEKPPEIDAGINLRGKSDLIMKPELFERPNLQIAKPVVSKFYSRSTESALEPGTREMLSQSDKEMGQCPLYQSTR
jgi:cytochrome P450